MGNDINKDLINNTKIKLNVSIPSPILNDDTNIAEITYSVSLADIIKNIANNCTYEQCFEVIKGIDLEIGDWDFTIELSKYYKKQKKEYKRLITWECE